MEPSAPSIAVLKNMQPRNRSVLASREAPPPPRRLDRQETSDWLRELLKRRSLSKPHPGQSNRSPKDDDPGPRVASPTQSTACGCWGVSCFPELTLFSRKDQLLERWRQQESLRQLQREMEREKALKEREQKREKKEQRRRKLEERRRQRERERQKEIEMVQWRLQILMERQRVEEEERQELQRLRELEKELQLKELRESEKEFSASSQGC
ncbi:hypothetical protein SRHO_G00049570 [Serrasalmus rhombeus]